jgi:Protein of unknown function (DUF3017)
MANRPANAGSDRGLAGAPPPVHHQGIPRNPGPPLGPPPAQQPAKPSARQPAEPSAELPAPPSRHRARGATSRSASRPLAVLPYLIVLAGVAVGLFVTWQGSRYAGLGTGLVGGALLAAAAARLFLPARYTELLSSRWKASDVVAFTVLGAGVLAIALALP